MDRFLQRYRRGKVKKNIRFFQMKGVFSSSDARPGRVGQSWTDVQHAVPWQARGGGPLRAFRRALDGESPA